MAWGITSSMCRRAPVAKPVLRAAIFAAGLLTFAVPALALDVSGAWEIAEEERTYHATVDEAGNGTYTWQGGVIYGSTLAGSRWSGSWKQPGNDREGGFLIELAEDGVSAKGRWWYSRVGAQMIPDPDFGGDYTWRKLSPAALLP